MIDKNEVWCVFEDRKVRVEKIKDSYMISWYKPDMDNGSVMNASVVVISDLAMQATIKCYLELNKDNEGEIK